MQNQAAIGQTDSDAFSLRNSTKEFRIRCDKVFVLLFDIDTKFIVFHTKIFERVLTHIAPAVREEQFFCVNFFNFLEEETVSGEVSYVCNSIAYFCPISLFFRM